MSRLPFEARSQTFGLDTDTPWSLPALRLLYSAPRIYAPLLSAWETRYPGTKRALGRLLRHQFVAHQGPLIVNTVDGQPAAHVTRPVPRYIITEKGKRLLSSVREDPRVLSDTYPRIASHNEVLLTAFLSSFDLPDSARRHGMSTAAARAASGMPLTNAKWWTRRWTRDGVIRQLPGKLADTREVIPEHYRPTRALSQQVNDVLEAYPRRWPGLAEELRVTRRRYLDDIDPARLGLTGATDFDHDIEAQRVLAHLLRSSHFNADGLLLIEPKVNLSVDMSTVPHSFDGPHTVFYQPDAEYREFNKDGRVRRSILEYERFQSRKDAWSHIERFLGWVHQRTLPTEETILRFVVDSAKREATYVQLIEAFADYCIDYPQRLVRNQVTLAVSSLERLGFSSDPLKDTEWFRVPLSPGGTDTTYRPVFHQVENSPYHDYFGR